ncbi:MAG: DUF998 domain-containing protein [Candidatus Thermoplasmatota archaeon]|nr:DUF998 domain-containing protein [Candidatus Thermoplasmatota archaeon]
MKEEIVPPNIDDRGTDALLIGGVSGIVAVVCFLVGYGTAWALSPWYDFGGNYLSDLGVGEGAFAFNIGVMSAGLITIPFAWGLWNALPEYILGKLGSVVCALAGIFLFLVGVFPEDQVPTHYIVSVSFFASLGVALMILAIPMIRSPVFRRVAAPLTIVIIVLSIVLVIPLGAGPLMETIAVLEALVWLSVASVQMILFARSEQEEIPAQE